MLCNLEALEPSPFDASQLHGITAGHLNDLMALTFIGDEKLANNPMFPQQNAARRESHPPASEQLTSSRSLDQMRLDLERLKNALYEEMSRTMEEDEEAIDHNADKKAPAAVSSSQSMRSLNQPAAQLVESTSLPSVDATVSKSTLGWLPSSDFNELNRSSAESDVENTSEHANYLHKRSLFFNCSSETV
jgi:hypothetical protein